MCRGYDLFHIDHLNLIRRAKEQGEYILVGVLTLYLFLEKRINYDTS